MKTLTSFFSLAAGLMLATLTSLTQADLGQSSGISADSHGTGLGGPTKYEW